MPRVEYLQSVCAVIGALGLSMAIACLVYKKIHRFIGVLVLTSGTIAFVSGVYMLFNDLNYYTSPFFIIFMWGYLVAEGFTIGIGCLKILGALDYLPQNTK